MLKRLARLANGWNPVFLPVPAMAEMLGSIKQMAKEAGAIRPLSLWSFMRAWGSPNNR